MDPFEAIPLEVQRIIFSLVPFRYFYVSLVSRRWNKLFWHTRESIVVHKDTTFIYKAKFNTEDEFKAVLTKLRPELVTRIAQQNEPFLISNLDKFKNLTSFTEYKSSHVNYYDEKENNVRIYSTLKNLPKLKHLELKFQNAAREKELFETIAACTALESLKLGVTNGYYFNNDTTPYLTSLKRLKDFSWVTGDVKLKTLAEAGIQLTRLELWNFAGDNTKHITVFTNLKSIVLHAQGKETFDALPTLTKLEEIDIFYVKYPGFYQDMQRLTSLQHLKRLNVFSVEDTNWQPTEQSASPFEWVTSLPALKCLQFALVTVGLPNNLSQCTALRDLKIKLETEDEVRALAQLTQLDALDIEEGYNVRNVYEVLSQLTQLKSVAVTVHNSDTESLPPQYWRPFTALKTLELNHIGYMQHEEVFALITAMPNMKKLYLRGDKIEELPVELIPNTNISFISTLGESDRFWTCEYTKHITDKIQWRFFDWNS